MLKSRYGRERPTTSFNKYCKDCHTPSGKVSRASSIPFYPALRPNAEKARFEANNFQMTEEDGRGKCRQGVFLDASRFNHSCLPNAWFNWNPDIKESSRGPFGVLTVYATKNISRGEDIRVDYQCHNCYQSKAQRRRSLKDAYNFACKGPACETKNLSEKRRAS